MKHWQRESRMVNAHRDFLIAQARVHVTDPGQRAECVRWLKNSRRTNRDAEQLAKRWGITLPIIN